MVEESKPKKRVNIRALESLIKKRASLAAQLGLQFEGDRELYEVLGYKKSLTFQNFFDKYLRQDIAARIVDKPAKDTWRNAPTITDDGRRQRMTQFERAFNRLAQRVRLWHYMERVDRVAGIGQYGVLLIGVRDGRGSNLESPMGDLTGPDDVLFLAPFNEENAEISTIDNNPSSPRFGMPTTYKLKLARNLTGTSEQVIERDVHHSRVIHVAEDMTEDDVFGISRLQRVYNLLDDMMKIVGGGAETYWINARKGMQFDVDPELELDEDDAEALEDEADEYLHGLSRFIRTRGVNIKDLGTDFADPRGPFQVLATLISGTTGIPMRILFGSERGELASSQDRFNWAETIKERQTSFVEPTILRPFIDRLIERGALPRPTGGEYTVNWPGVMSLSEEDVSKISARKARATVDLARAKQFGTPLTVAEERELLGFDPEPMEDEIPRPTGDVVDDE